LLFGVQTFRFGSDFITFFGVQTFRFGRDFIAFFLESKPLDLDVTLWLFLESKPLDLDVTCASELIFAQRKTLMELKDIPKPIVKNVKTYTKATSADGVLICISLMNNIT